MINLEFAAAWIAFLANLTFHLRYAVGHHYEEQSGFDREVDGRKVV